MTDLDLSKILDGFYRRKGLIIAVSIVGLALSSYLAWSLPDVYRSSTLILISPQKVPASYISSTVTLGLQERIHAMTQQILSRTRLERIINEFDLYPPQSPAMTMEDRVEKFRKNIRLDVRGNDSFLIAFEASTPEQAMQVAGRLASLFIEENLQLREQQAVGTTAFVNSEADRLRKELEQEEREVNSYQAQYRFELPGTLDSNLRTMEQLRGELTNNTSRLSSLKERQGMLKEQLAESESLGAALMGGAGSTFTKGVGGNEARILRLRAEMDALLTRYSENHPDVATLKQQIKNLEADSQKEKEKPATKGSSPRDLNAGGNPLQQMLLTQIEEMNSEIVSLQSQNEKLRTQVEVYQARIDNTPLRGIELTKISRNYDITLRKYQDLLSKSLDSQLSENLEKKQKGEQFQILDPASFPLKPIRPNRPFILGFGVLASLGLGFGLSFLYEGLDTSFKRTEEVNSYVDIPLLATIPAIVTRATVLEQRRKRGWLIISSVGALTVGVIFIRFFGTTLF